MIRLDDLNIEGVTQFTYLGVVFQPSRLSFQKICWDIGVFFYEFVTKFKSFHLSILFQVSYMKNK